MKGNELRPDARAFLDLLNMTPLRRFENLSVEQARQLIMQMRSNGEIQHNLAVVHDVECHRSGLATRLRLYDALSDDRPGPVIVYYHGGGFVFGDLESHHALCIEIAQTMLVPLIAVDYRLAPEHPWPAAPDDAEAAARWIACHASAVLDRSVTSLILAGDSAGANLAATTARALRDEPTAVPVSAQFLIYPCTAAYAHTQSRALYADDLFLTKNGIDWFFRHYAAPAGDPRFDLFAFEQTGMPPTLLVTAGRDPLRDEGRAYAAALISAGVPVIFQEALGNIHGCFGLAAAIPSSVKDVSRALAALRLLVTE